MGQKPDAVSTENIEKKRKTERRRTDPTMYVIPVALAPIPQRIGNMHSLWISAHSTLNIYRTGAHLRRAALTHLR
jgi:hypothetical protein